MRLNPFDAANPAADGRFEVIPAQSTRAGAHRVQVRGSTPSNGTDGRARGQHKWLHRAGRI
jgi:hypothetical protein